MKDVMASLDWCKLCELFHRLRDCFAECSRCPELAGSEENAQEIERLRAKIIEMCSRPILPLDLVDLDEAAAHGSRRYAREVVNMAIDFIRSGGRVVLQRTTSLSSPPEVVAEFARVEKFEDYAQRWV